MNEKIVEDLRKQREEIISLLAQKIVEIYMLKNKSKEIKIKDLIAVTKEGIERGIASI